MFKAFEFCVPTKSTVVPDGPDWLHEIKYDGYRLRVERDGDRVRLITRGGYDWTKRYPWIVEAARKVRQRRFVIDGEAVEPAPCLIPSLSRETARDRLGIDAIGQRFRLYAVNRLAVCVGQVRTPSRTMKCPIASQ